MFVKIILSGQQDLLLGCCYRPKVSDRTTIPDLVNIVGEFQKLKHKNILLGGGFNFPEWDWSDKKLKPNTPNSNLHEDFMSFLNTYGMTQHVTEPTRQGNTLDLVALKHNRENKSHNIKVLPGASDHDIVYAEIALKTNHRKIAPKTIWLYKRASWQAINDEIEPLLNDIIYKDSSVESF